MEQETCLIETGIKLWNSYTCVFINIAGLDATRSAKETHGQCCGWWLDFCKSRHPLELGFDLPSSRRWCVEEKDVGLFQFTCARSSRVAELYLAG
jgi:hypothetical protein